VNGVVMPLQLVGEVNGTRVQPSSWVVDFSSVARVDADGLVTATGTVGGEVRIRATYNEQTASATVRVNVKHVVDPGATTHAEQEQLRQATITDGTAVWTYPYDRTVFPKGLLPPTMMWNNAGAGDKYYFKLTGQYAELELFITADPPSRFSPELSHWRALTESGPGGPVDVHVARLSAGAATVVINHQWTIANGSLRGTMYHLSTSTTLGRVVRTRPGAAAPEDFLPATVQGCVECHALSADGSTMILGGDAPASTVDLVNNTALLDIQDLGKPVRNWAMAAVSPNGAVLIENNAPLSGPPGGSDGMWNARTGTKLQNTGLEGVLLDMPAFAPTGTKIAFVDHVSKTLATYDFDVANITVSNRADLVEPGADINTNKICFPSLSPDARWVAYRRGATSSCDTRSGPGNLYLASVDQPGVEIRLARLNGDNFPFAAGTRDQNLNYMPIFVPVSAGGFTWVLFTSRRTYGNLLIGPARMGDGEGVKQIWLAAIDENPRPGEDPSHPALRMPGQDFGLNLRAFLVPEPCKPAGASCEAQSECCSQNCDQLVCTPLGFN